MNTLASILSSRVRAAIFELLFGATDAELHLREFERRSGLSVMTVRQDLKKLEQMGLVTARRDGNRLYYRANRSHPLYPDIRSLVLKTAGLVDVLRDALGQEGIRVAFVFGSVAEGKETAESDVDLMIVGGVGLREVSRRLAGASDKIGREINPHVLSPAEFRRRVRRADHFLSTVMASPRLLAVGTEDDLAGLGQGAI
jgi:DNA-binding transcriptional ArsR family regulator